jgi:peroxiredoxin
MVWIRFDEHDRRTPAPLFSLSKPDGGLASSYDYYEKSSLVLLFLHSRDVRGVSCPSCLKTLVDFFARYPEYLAEGAEIVAVMPDRGQFPAGGEAQQLPIPLLIDPGGTARARFASLVAATLVPEHACMAFVLDRYGCPYAAFIAPELDEVALQDDILRWASYISIQCPE